MLSQAGHGRGAAAATPQDAALLLLACALGVPSLHAVLIGEAILACTLGAGDDEAEVREVVGGAVGHVAGLIAAGKDMDVIQIHLVRETVGVVISNDSSYFHYQIPPGLPIRRKLEAKFGRPRRLVREYRAELRGGVLPEISEFLGVKAAAEDAA